MQYCSRIIKKISILIGQKNISNFGETINFFVNYLFAFSNHFPIKGLEQIYFLIFQI